jgi:dynein heavy chain
LLARPYQGNPTFDPEFIRSKSTAAAGLCSWCINIVRFYEVYCDVAPKRQALEEANAELAEAQEKLTRIKNKIAVSAGSLARSQPCEAQEPLAQAAGQYLRGKCVGSA